MRHELAHALFGLADEYPGFAESGCSRNGEPEDPTSRDFTHGDGGYYQNHSYPNLWEDEEQCLQALENFSGSRIGGCRSFVGIRPVLTDKTWYTMDPGISEHDTPGICERLPIDIMVDDTIPQLADRARMDWVIRMCNSAACGAGDERTGCMVDLQCLPGRVCRDVIDPKGEKVKVCTRSDRF